MSLYAAIGGSDVVLGRWSIRETNSGARHFLGFNLVDGDGRVSTPIQSFDPVTRTGVTTSGSTYRLVGPAGQDKDAEYVWFYAAKAWRIEQWTDITAELVPDCRRDLPLSEQHNIGSQDDDSDEI